MIKQRLAGWNMLAQQQRARMVVKQSRTPMETPRVADLYWRQRERKVILMNRLTRRAMQDERFADWYWLYRKRQAEKRFRS